MTFFLLAGTGCTSIQLSGTRTPSDSSMVGRDSNDSWWKYYNRALDYAEKGLYSEALHNLHQAIQIDDFDRWHAKTPDNNVIDYFPHRQLGIIHFKRKEYSAAIEQLEYSIESEESAKAFFYLDFARAAKITRDSLDQSPPEIYLESSSTKEVTTAFIKQFEGVVRDDTFVDSIKINDKLITLNPARKKYIFSYDYPLHEGENTVVISAKDLSGKSDMKEIHITGDRQGPVIEIISASFNGNKYDISGRVSDTGGLASLYINSHLWPITGTFGVYNFTFSLPTDNMTITARDRAGNVTDITLHRDVFEGGKESVPVSPENILQKENKPPLIRIEGLQNELETLDDSITFRVQVSDAEGIHSLFVNTVPVLMTNGSKIYFTQKQHLEPGPNDFYFVAFDTSGNKSSHKIRVFRKAGNILVTDARMRVAVLPFSLRGFPEIHQQEVIETLSEILVEQKRFRFAGQQESQLLKGRMSTSGLTLSSNKPSATEAYFPAVDALLTGSVHIEEGYAEVIGQFIDPRTNAIMAFNDVFGTVSEPGDIIPLFNALMEKFNKDFPIRFGRVTDVSDGKIRINLGTKDGIRKYSQFIVYRDSPPIFHPVLKTVTQTDPDIIGYIQVTELNEHSASAQVVQETGSIRKFDKIIAK